MTIDGERVMLATESVCPECLARIPAMRVAEGDDVYLEKQCPDHGAFRTIVWRGHPAYAGWARPKIPAYPANPFTPIAQGCPFDCGLCSDHRQQTCTALLEVTQRCDLRCAYCFASAGDDDATDRDLKTIEGWFRRLLDAGGPYNVQLSGGEPTQRDDLPDIVALGMSLGFSFIQLNTNGLRLARDAEYVRRLKRAGLSSVFLQFDGTRDDISAAMRGVKLLARKQTAIERCAENDLGVVLVPTLVPGVNVDDIGAILDFALRHFPAVRGVHFQPVSYFGRYPQPPADADRITIPEVIQAVDAQTGGRFPAGAFTTSGCENALCSLHGNFVVMPDGDVRPWTRHTAACECAPIQAEVGAAKTRAFVAQYWSTGGEVVALDDIDVGGFGEWDVFLSRARTHTFCISGMAFQDAWNLDLDRLRDCCIHTVSPDGRLIPFCAYNLTDRQGRSLYRNH
jgi:uncharacterized radical SAM superfamily Fe-S cluster-containing enzyme